jgi:hypothetical protein
MSGQIILDLSERSSTPKATVGQYHIDNLGRHWQYVKASAAIAVYEYVKVSGDGLYTISSMTTTTNPSTEPANVGCAQTAFASGDYGYVFRGFGVHTGLFAASCAQNVKIYTTATGGVVDDAATTLVNGLKLITTITSAASAPAFASGLLTTAAA